MEAIHSLNPAIQFEIYTQVPAWFFEDCLAATFNYHPLLTDIGVVQKTSLAEDLPQTLHRLDQFLPFDPGQIENLAQQVVRLNCSLVICDIAPMGIAVAQAAGLPAVLIENFTWDWIYEGYLSMPGLAASSAAALERHIDYLRRWFKAADYHLQTEPIGRPSQEAALSTGPISRRIRRPAGQVRKRLGLPKQAPIVMITMGGIPWHYTFLEQLCHRDGLYFVIAGADVAEPEKGQDNILLLPHHSDFYHPDLINAAQVVIGKAGYSTIAEVYQAGVPFGYIGRPHFRETQALVAYIKAARPNLSIPEAAFQDGRWLTKLPELLAMPRLQHSNASSAAEVARFILSLRQ